MAKSLKKNVVLSTVLSVSNFAFPLITYSYVARVLTPEGTGRVAFVDSIVAYFLYVAALGVHPYGRREVAKCRDDKRKLSELVMELLSINLVATCLSYMALFITVIAVPGFRVYKLLFLILSSQLLLKLFSMEWLYEGMEEYVYITVRSLLFKVLSVVLTFVLVKSPDDVAKYAFLHVFATSMSGICNLIYARKFIKISRVKLKCVKRHIKSILVLFFASIAITIYANCDVTMIGIMGSEYEVGLYNASMKTRGVVIALSTAITTALVPRLSYYFEKKMMKEATGVLSKSVILSLLSAVPLSCFIIFNSTDVLGFIGGEAYIPASDVLVVLMLCVFALIVTNLCGVQILIPLGKEKKYTQSVVIGVFINVGMNALLIPWFGALGAAIATLITEIWNVFWMGRECLPYVKSIISEISFGKYGCALIISTALNLLMRHFVVDMGLISRLIVTTSVFFVVYYALLVLFKESYVCSVFNNIVRRMKRN